MTTIQYAEDAAQFMTNHVLDRYVGYLRAQAARDERGAPETEAAPLPADVPTTLEEALAPLEIIYGKTFLSAVAIALHGAEPVIRYVEAADVSQSAPHDQIPTTARSSLGGDWQASSSPSSGTAAARSFYRVGEYVLYSPYYCPCSAYAFQSVRRQEVWCCKHMLALQLALRVEASGIAQDNLRERVVDSTSFQSVLLESLTM